MSDPTMDEAEASLINRIISEDVADLPRAFQMARRYARGETLQEIADDYALTRERVRQVINNETPWTTTMIGESRRRVLEEKAAAEREVVQAWSQANPGAPIAQAVEDLEVDEDAVRRYLGRRRGRHERVERNAPARRSDDNLLDDLRRFREETDETSTAAYARWARSAGVPGPQTVAIRFGSWNTATTKAGIKDAAPIDRERRHSDEDLWAVVVEGVRAGQFTAREFEDWLLTISGAPSFALVRQRLVESWIELRDEALRVLSGRSDRDPAWIEDVSTLRDWASFLDEEDPLDHMRAARLALGRNITMVRYAEWAQANKRPGAMTVMRRSGKRWAELVEAVGGTAVHKQLRIADDELLAWLRAFLEAEPGGAYAAYDEWREPFGAPGAGTIAMRFGGWNKARALALA